MIRLADTLGPMGDFPAAMAENVNLVTKEGTEADLQTLYDEGKLGGGGDGLPTPEAKDKVLLTKINGDTLKPEWQQVDKGEVGLQLPEFESLEEWDSLPADEKSKYYNAGKGYVVIKEDIKGAKGVIDDTRPTSTVTTLSAKKINDSLVDIESDLSELCVPKTITTITDFHVEKIGKLVIVNCDGCMLSVIKQNLQLPSKRYLGTLVFNPKGTYSRRHGLIRLTSVNIDAWWHTGDGGETSADDNDRVWGSLIYILD